MKASPDYRKNPLGVGLHFLDSGAFTLKTRAAEYAARTGKDERAFYDTKTHWHYVDAYCRFVRDHWQAIDFFANVDAIPHPDLTWRNQDYIEQQWGMEPVPVVHYGTNLTWFDRYVEAGYTFVGIGGLVGETSTEECRRWLDDLFTRVCPPPTRLPTVRLHGFGLTSVELMFRYPWWSVDSASWTKVGSFGGILVPQRRGGAWVYDETPYVMKVADENPDRDRAGCHFAALPPRQQQLVRDWLDDISVPLGSDKERGVVNSHLIRKDACIMFFHRMVRAVPPYPRPFTTTVLRRLV